MATAIGALKLKVTNRLSIQDVTVGIYTFLSTDVGIFLSISTFLIILPRLKAPLFFYGFEVDLLSFPLELLPLYELPSISDIFLL